MLGKWLLIDIQVSFSKTFLNIGSGHDGNPHNTQNKLLCAVLKLVPTNSPECNTMTTMSSCSFWAGETAIATLPFEEILYEYQSD